LEIFEGTSSRRAGYGEIFYLTEALFSHKASSYASIIIEIFSGLFHKQAPLKLIRLYMTAKVI